MKKIPVVIMVLVLLAIKTSYSLRFIALGNSRSSTSVHQAMVDAYSQENPELIIYTGNLWDGYTAAVWKEHLTGHEDIDSLLNNNKILVARGNYEEEKTVLNFKPDLVKDYSLTYSFKEGNCFFVCMGYDPGANNNWMDDQLKSSEAQAADWRFVYANKGIYSTAPNGADGTISDGSNVTHFRELCDKYDITMVFGGHNAIYERTYLIYDGEVTDTDSDIKNLSKDKGTVYIMTGGAGAPLEDVDDEWWVKENASKNHFCTINALKDSLYVVVQQDNGDDINTFYVKRGDYIKILSPIGIEEWKTTEEHDISWEDNIDEKVKIELLINNSVVKTVENSVDSDSPYKWTIPTDVKESLSYKIKISSVDDNSIYGISPNKFIIRPGIGIIANNNAMQSYFDLKFYASQLHFRIPEFNGNRQYHVNIKMYNMQGKLISTLINNYLNAGNHSIKINKHNNTSGLYLCKIEIEGFTGTIPILIK